MKLNPYFKLLCLACLLLAGGNRLYATTYRLVQVTSVEAGCKYVFVEGSRAITTLTGNVLKYTTKYTLENLTGNETYIWELVAATDGFYMKMSNGKYLTIESGVDFSEKEKTKDASIWNVVFTDGLARFFRYKDLDNRFIGYNGSNGYKAYDSFYNLDNVNIAKDFTVYQLVTDITITSAKYATFCAEVGLDFSDTGAKVYTAKVQDGKAKLTEIEGGIVPANTGFLIYKDVNANETISAAVKVNNASVSDNELVGTIAETTVSWEEGGRHNYILQTDGEGKAKFFKAKAEGAKLIANRAYLSTSATVSAHELDITFDEEGETTGVADVRSKKSEVRGECFNLQGQRVNANHKGIVIVGGKKVFNP